MVQPETRQQQLEPTIHDEHAANISSSIWMAPGDSAVNATHSESPVTKPCTLEAEDLTQRQMTVPICPQSTSLTVFPDSESTLLSSDWNEALGDDEADAFLPSPSKTDSHTLTPFREAYPRTHQIKELSDSGESKHKGIPFQPKISSPGDTTLIMLLDDAPKDPTVACPPTKQCTFWNGLVIKNRIKPPKLIGFHYDPGGYPKIYATWVGGGYLNGTAEAVYRDGLVYCQAPFGYAVSLLLGGSLFAVKMRKTDAITMLDPFQRRYGKWVSLLLLPPAVCGEIVWTAAMLAALGSTAEVIVELDQVIAIVVSATVTFFYTSLGGLYSVSYTDGFQAFIVTLGLWVCVPFCLGHRAVGKAPLPDRAWAGEIRFGDAGTLVDHFATTALGGIPWQVYFERTQACPSIFIVHMMSYVSAFGVLFLAIPPMIMGAAAKTANCDDADFTIAGYRGPYRLPANDMPAVLPHAIRYLTPTIVSILGLGAITAAVMSSADSSVLSASSLITKNVYYALLRPQASPAEMTVVVRATVGLVGVAATVMALSVQSVYALWYLCADVVYVMLFPQLLCLFYLDQLTNTYGLICGVLTGLVVRVLCGEPAMHMPVYLRLPLFDEAEGQKFPYRTLCMVLNLLVTVGGSALLHRLFLLGILPRKLDCCRYCTLAGDGARMSSTRAYVQARPHAETRCHVAEDDTAFFEDEAVNYVTCIAK
ncbi:high-affinity choline transporter 1-like [Haemaphysalis longicornis]